MASRRRQRKRSVFEDLLELPWYINLGAAVAVYLPLKYLPFLIEAKSPVMSSFLSVVSSFAILIALVPFAAAIVSGFRAVIDRSGAPSEPAKTPYRQRKTIAPVDIEQVKRNERDLFWYSSSMCDAGQSLQQIQRPESISLKLLSQIEWKRFEELCRAYLEVKGTRAETTRVGPDGGVDIRLFKGKSNKPVALVQCKAWNACQVGVKPVRELFGVMAAEGIAAGVFMTTGSFTQEARAFAVGKKLILLSGEVLVDSILKLPDEVQKMLLEIATKGDFTTPTCPRCDTKLVKRTISKGNQAGSTFWGCTGYPKCKVTLKFRPEAA